MWLQTTIGFFSIVQEAGEAHLTVRARARGDLERLRDGYLPELGAIREGEGTDYRYRATAPHDAVAQAVARLVIDILQADTGYTHGAFVFLYPEGNTECARAVEAYERCLNGTSTFQAWTLESFVEDIAAIREATAAPVRERYLVT
jgi:hypothetical protein